MVLNFPNSRENISVQLSSTLILDNYYLVKFYTNKVNCIQYAHNNIALNFSSTLTTTVASGTTVNLPMHIYKFGNPIISDTLNWTEIMGIYKSNGTEQYITIGNFKDDANTQVLLSNPTNSSTASYYIIDDVSVEPICTPFWSYRDTTVAIGDSVLIGPCITGLNINWYDATGTFITNAPGIYVKPNSPTFYTATEDFCGSIITHTINVGVSPVGGTELGIRNDVVGVYPNPTSSILNIDIKGHAFRQLSHQGSKQMLNQVQHDYTIKITDMLGKEVLLSNYKEQLDISALQNGIYFLSLYKNNQWLVTKKIVRQ